MQYGNHTPSPQRSNNGLQGQQGRSQNQKKGFKASQKKMNIISIQNQRTNKMAQQITSQRSPVNMSTKTTKQTIETKRSVSPEELKKKSRKSPQQTKQQSSKDTNNIKQKNGSPLKKYIKQKQVSQQMKENELKQKLRDYEQKKQCNLDKLKRKTKKIFEKSKKQKKQCIKDKPLQKEKVIEIKKKFEEISKRFEKFQNAQIEQFQQLIAQKQLQNLEKEKDQENIYEYYLNQAAQTIQVNWREFLKRQKQQRKSLPSQRQSIDWEANAVMSQQTLNSDEGLLFCQGGEKQVHISNIRSSVVSEESLSIMNQLNQELDNWNVYIQSIVKNQDLSQINRQMQQSIINIVQNHLKKSESLSDKRSENEIHQERSFNSYRKKLSDELSKSSILQLQQQALRGEGKLLGFREEAIYLRYEAEKKSVNSENKQSLDEWLNNELEDLQNTRKAIEICHKREISALKKIQRDILIASEELDKDSSENQQIQIISKQIDDSFNQVTKQKYENIFQEDIQKTINLITGEIFNDLLDELIDEVQNNKDNFFIFFSDLNKDIISIAPTSVREIQSYLEALFKFVLENYSTDLLKHLNLPFGFTPLKRMKLIHGYDDDENNEEIDQNIAFPLSDHIFIEFENQRLQELDLNDQIAFTIRELEHIHNKAIFDASNEALNYERPYFLNSGIVYPWQKINQRIFMPNQLEQILEQSKKKVIDWSSFLCGFLPLEENEKVKEEKQQIIEEKKLSMKLQQLNLFENPTGSDYNSSFDNLGLIRDEQLYKLLIQDIKESENKWYLVEDERVDYLMELSDQIFEQLIEEFQKEF
ncbi:unnamed protein product (macronuclear) [Paramecium tetraurelia]|uniref:DUF4378 domain-containing protein n=1 Tax=Paramecium tetraurelia TaxID=5888 RepID=A0BPP7_PARTE|nr:uncharacterized protein GSPATT00005264001 [Paramecium tetraurelia]CAK60514.1 unnamed protein product [Paramecium tetraurelia]|eukprot:XP_001427912.1 hypothetical protein (macronuclear) [Paramecium tetraurelia strain d4-2]